MRGGGQTHNDLMSEIWLAASSSSCQGKQQANNFSQLRQKRIAEVFFFKLNFKLPVPLGLLEVSWSQHAWLDLHSVSVALDFSGEEVHHQFLLPDWK